MEGGIHVSIKAEQITQFLGVPITNTLLMSWVVVVVLALLAFSVNRGIKLVPGKLQLILEMMVGGVLGFIETTLESKDLARKYFPFITTIFLFIFTANMLEFIPGVGSIGLLAHQAVDAAAAAHNSGATSSIAQAVASASAGSVEKIEFIPLLRSTNTDLNVTLALAIISFLTIEISGIVIVGFFKYFSRFFNFHSPIMFFVGLIEFVSELIRLISFSFRLFGNIFAGEVLLAVATFFLPFVGPVPFMAFEVFVGFIQAAIFSLLTLFFLKLAVTDTAH